MRFPGYNGAPAQNFNIYSLRRRSEKLGVDGAPDKARPTCAIIRTMTIIAAAARNRGNSRAASPRRLNPGHRAAFGDSYPPRLAQSFVHFDPLELGRSTVS
jgi:hypothetical protein